MFNLDKQVFKTIKEKVSKMEAFSAWDITVCLRQEFPMELIYHSEVKPLVHQLFETNNKVFDGYDRDNGQHGYFLYSPCILPILAPPAGLRFTFVKSAVDMCNLRPGDKANVYLHKNKPMLSQCNLTDYYLKLTQIIFVGQFTVDRSYNVRVAKSTLRKFGYTGD